MIRVPGGDGVAFTEAGDGDQRDDLRSRSLVSASLGIPEEWASLNQIHGNLVHRVDHPGVIGEGDAMWSTVRNLPLAVFTADCFGVVLHAREAVGVAHAGWRGSRAGVVARLRDEMAAEGHAPTRAALGPGIGACCFEVGEEVSTEFEGFTTATTWGTPSVDLAAVIRTELSGLEVWDADDCTFHQPGSFSFRRDQTSLRMATIGWLP
ncbi:MAG TPA: polyphenol oxidase family protein [Acidimicrobiia bacterium]